MSLTTDPNDPNLGKVRSNGQNETYLVLSEEERQKGFVRPVRKSYKHIGVRPKNPTRPLTEEELKRHVGLGYVCYEEYPKSESAVCGRFWTKAQLESGCGVVTTMNQALAETYARDPKFYGATFCCGCNKHFRVGEDGEFIWELDGTFVGT